MSRVALKGILMAGGEGLLQLSDESPDGSYGAPEAGSRINRQLQKLALWRTPEKR